MIEAIPTLAINDAELEAWFNEAGLSATVVRRCPEPMCSWCSRPLDGPLADAA
jgi:hypothetical protein